jgi:hypothetical protein
MFKREPPTNLNTGSKVRLKRWNPQSCIADERWATFHLDRPQPKTLRFKVSSITLNHGSGFFWDKRLSQELADALIRIQEREQFQVFVAPSPKKKS